MMDLFREEPGLCVLMAVLFFTFYSVVETFNSEAERIKKEAAQPDSLSVACKDTMKTESKPDFYFQRRFTKKEK